MITSTTRLTVDEKIAEAKRILVDLYKRGVGAADAYDIMGISHAAVGAVYVDLEDRR